MAQGDRDVVSPKLHEQMKIREVTPPGFDGRRWDVTLPDEVVFVVTLGARDLHRVPSGTHPLDRSWSDDEIVRVVVGAVEKRRGSPPAQEPGSRHYVDATSHDLYEANDAS